MNSIYGDALPMLEAVRQDLMDKISSIRREMEQELGMDPIEHLLSRIKAEDSMREKCRRRGLPETAESALGLSPLGPIYDAVGLRIVCAFPDDVYTIRDRLLALPQITLVEEKDYIRHVKPNGYRSLHLILRYEDQCFAEIQLRTISMDTWAALEHHLKYKKEIHGNLDLITAELKRCADELASTDASMQTLRDMIHDL